MRNAWFLLPAITLAAVACRYEDLPPLADITGPDEVGVGDWVQLEGSSSSDPEGHALIYRWQFLRLPEGSTTDFNEERAANPSFLADAAGEYEVELLVDDGLVFGDPVTHVVTAIQGNRRPLADAGPDVAAALDAVITLDGTGSSDPDEDALTFGWGLVSQPDGAASALDDATSATPAFTARREGAYVWSLVVSDRTLSSDADRVTISVGRENLRPVADAGVDQLADLGALVTLDGSRSSDPNGDELTWAWTISARPTGSTAALDDATLSAPAFTADVAGTYRVQLVVSDGADTSTPDEVVVTAVASSEPPVADAGDDDAIPTGVLYQLDGSGSSDPEDDPLSFRWQLVAKPLGATAMLNDAAVVNPSLTPDADGVWVAHLWVSDGLHEVGPDEVVLTASGANRAPTAIAGPDQSLLAGATVALTGAGSSDPDGDLLGYDWAFQSVPAGSQAHLNIRSIVNPSFVADVAGTYVVDLVVRDGALASEVDSVQIVASVSNAAPVADAGVDRGVARGDVVELGGTSTDADGDPLFYEWWLLSVPAGSAAALSDPNLENPWFLADVAGTYVVRLQVSDGQALSNIDEVVITAGVGNRPPTADAGDDLVDETGTGGDDNRVATHAPVTLDGAGSDDPDNDVLSFLWQFVSVPEGATATFNTVTADSPTFVPDVDGTWVAELTVSDGELTDTDRVIVESIGANQAPVADAGPDQTVREGSIVQLNGAGSYDLDPNDDLTYHWWFHELPSGFFADFNDPGVVNPSFVADTFGTLVARLQVDDGRTVSNIDEVVITILEAFKIVAFTPEENQIGVSLNTTVTLTFNEAADTGTLNESNFWVNPGTTSDFATRVPATISWDAGSLTATLTPTGGLDPLTVYTVTVTENVQSALGDPLDREYTWQFETRAGEILLYTEPADGETDVPVSTAICGIFTDDVDPATVDAGTFSVTFPDRWDRLEEPVTGTYTFEGVDPASGAPSGTFTANKVCFVPQPDEYDCEFDRPLLYDTTYTATITTLVALEGSGDTLTTNFTWSFETTTAPALVSTDPEDGDEDIPIVIDPLAATFDREIDPTSVTTGTVTLETWPGGIPVSATVAVGSDGMSVELSPDADLDYDTEYRFTVVSGLSGVLDVEGNWLMDDVEVTFRTSPANAYVMVPNVAANNDAEEGDLIELLFERALDPAAVNATNIEVFNDTIASVVNSNFAYDPDTQAISIVTIPETLNGNDYTVTVFPGLLDHLGNPFPVETSVSFEVTGSSNNNPSFAISRTNDQGHGEYLLDGTDNIMVTSITPQSVWFRDASGADVPFRVVAYDVSDDTITIRPVDYLRSALGPYTVQVNGAVTDLQRNPAAIQTESFGIEATAPTVTSASPTSQVGGAATFTITFNERMDEASLTASSVRLLVGSGPTTVPAVLEVASDGLSVTLDPIGYLDAAQDYTLEVTTGATDTAGNGATAPGGATPFQAAVTVDDTPPSVSSVVPADLATGISPDTDVTVFFDEWLDESTFMESIVGSDGTVRLTDPSGNDAWLCVEVDGAHIHLDPVDPLAAGTTWDVTVDGSVTDAAGNALGTDFTSSFDTSP